MITATTREFSVVGKNLKNHKTVKIGEWTLAEGWALARDNTVLKKWLHDECRGHDLNENG